MTDLYLNDKLIQSDVKTGYKHSFTDLQSDTEFKVELRADGSIIDSKIVKTLPKKNKQKYWAYYHYPGTENKLHKLTNDSVIDLNIGSAFISFLDINYEDGFEIDKPENFATKKSIKESISVNLSDGLYDDLNATGFIMVIPAVIKNDEIDFIKNINHKILGSIPDITFKVLHSKTVSIPWIDKSKSEIQTELNNRNINFKKSATKSELLELLGGE